MIPVIHISLKVKHPVRVMLLVGLLLLSPATDFAQTPVTVSQTIEQYNGKAYYLHRVAPQQTLYSIAKAYGITAEAVLIENPESRSGIRAHQVLRIPVARTNTGQTPPQQQKPEAVAGEDTYDYVYHVAGKNENFKYLSEVYLVNERLIRNANSAISEPFHEGDYILVPISKKDNRPSVTDTRFKRSEYDPILQPPPKAPPVPDRRQLASSSKIETVSPFDSPLNPSPEPVSPTRTEPMAQSTEKGPATPKDIHIVKPKETLFSIARLYGLKNEALMAANPGLQQNLRVGQVIKLPVNINPPSNETAVPDSMITHTVVKGETLYKISRLYGVGIDELKKINPGLTETLTPGQKINLPKKKTTDSYLIHKVQNRQKSKTLARDYGLTQDELMKANPSLGSEVFPNQKVKIPIARRSGTQPIWPEETKAISEEPAVNEAETIQEAELPVVECSSVSGTKKFKIALMLPLNLDQIASLESSQVNDENKQQIIRFLPFYKGFVMAADSLARYNNLKAELKIFDVGQSTAGLNQIINDSWLADVDLIVGPFFSQPFKKMAEFALEKGIMIVNPLSQRREILENNPYVIKVKPDISQLATQTASLVANRYGKAKIFIYGANSFRNQTEIQQLREAIEENIPHEVNLNNEDLLRRLRQNSDLSFSATVEDNWIDISALQANPGGETKFSNQITFLTYDRDSLRSFRKNASQVRDNIIIAYGEDRVFAMEFLNKLNQHAENLPVKLVGLPNWGDFDNLFNESLLKLNAHFFSDGYINYNDQTVNTFIQQYRSKYNTEPEQYAFEGFDVGWYFLQYLNQHGNTGNCLHQFPMKLLHTQYHFKRLDESAGFENLYWDIYKFDNFTTIPLMNASFYQ